MTGTIASNCCGSKQTVEKVVVSTEEGEEPLLLFAQQDEVNVEPTDDDVVALDEVEEEEDDESISAADLINDDDDSDNMMKKTMKLNEAFEALEAMRKVNLEVEFAELIQSSRNDNHEFVSSPKILDQYCTVCLRDEKKKYNEEQQKQQKQQQQQDDKEESGSSAMRTTFLSWWKAHQKRRQQRITASTCHACCFVCASPVCNEHCSKSDDGLLRICTDSCQPFLHPDDLKDKLDSFQQQQPADEDEEPEEEEETKKEEVNSSQQQQQQKAKEEFVSHMMDSYDRSLLLLQYACQYEDLNELADNLEGSSRSHTKIHLGGSGMGFMAGVTGVGAMAPAAATAAKITTAAAMLTPMGPSMLAASLVFGGTAAAVTVGHELKIHKFYNCSEEQQRYRKLLAWHAVVTTIASVVLGKVYNNNNNSNNNSMSTATTEDKKEKEEEDGVCCTETAIVVYQGKPKNLFLQYQQRQQLKWQDSMTMTIQTTESTAMMTTTTTLEWSSSNSSSSGSHHHENETVSVKLSSGDEETEEEGNDCNTCNHHHLSRGDTTVSEITLDEDDDIPESNDSNMNVVEDVIREEEDEEEEECCRETESLLMKANDQEELVEPLDGIEATIQEDEQGGDELTKEEPREAINADEGEDRDGRNKEDDDDDDDEWEPLLLPKRDTEKEGILVETVFVADAEEDDEEREESKEDSNDDGGDEDPIKDLEEEEDGTNTTTSTNTTTTRDRHKHPLACLLPLAPLIDDAVLSVCKVFSSPTGGARMAISRASSHAVKVTQVASVACGALSAFSVFFEAYNIDRSLKRLEGPCNHAERVRNLQHDVLELPDTKIIAEAMQEYLHQHAGKGSSFRGLGGRDGSVVPAAATTPQART